MSEEKKTKKKSGLKKLFSLPKHIGSLKGKGTYMVNDYTFTHGRLMQKTPTKGLVASVEHGAVQNSYSSKGAIGVGAVAGTVIAGPLGGLVGGLAGSTKRKGGSKIYFVVRDAEGRSVVTEEFPVKEEDKVRKFVDILNASAQDPKNGVEEE